MKVTRVKYFPIDRLSDSHPLAACSVTLDDVFMVHDIKIYSGNIVVMPQRKVYKEGFTKTNSSKSNDLCHPIDRKFFDEFKNVVLEGYAVFKGTGERYYTP